MMATATWINRMDVDGGDADADGDEEEQDMLGRGVICLR